LILETQINKIKCRGKNFPQKKIERGFFYVRFQNQQEIFIRVVRGGIFNAAEHDFRER